MLPKRKIKSKFKVKKTIKLKRRKFLVYNYTNFISKYLKFNILKFEKPNRMININLNYFERNF